MLVNFYDELRSSTASEAQGLFIVPQISDGLAGKISRETYVAYLTEAYHHVRHTVPLMRAAQVRMTSAQSVFSTALDDYVAEETGHEMWILDDIAACGADREVARASQPRFATEMMVAYAYDFIHRINPMGFFGMVFVLEGTSVLLATRGASAVQHALGLPPSAFRYLTSHGSLDQDHLVFFERLMNQVTSRDDKDAIIHVAKRMFVLFGEVFRAIPHTQVAAHAA